MTDNPSIIIFNRKARLIIISYFYYVSNNSCCSTKKFAGKTRPKSIEKKFQVCTMSCGVLMSICWCTAYKYLFFLLIFVYIEKIMKIRSNALGYWRISMKSFLNKCKSHYKYDFYSKNNIKYWEKMYCILITINNYGYIVHQLL